MKWFEQFEVLEQVKFFFSLLGDKAATTIDVCKEGEKWSFGKFAFH